MASELEPEPEVPAIDQSLLECSAEETAGVSAWTRAGRPALAGSAPWEDLTPGNPGAARLRLGVSTASGSPASPSGEQPGEAADPAPFLLSLFSNSPQSCSVHQPPLHSLSAQENQQLFIPASPTLPLSPQHKGLCLLCQVLQEGRKRLGGVVV